MVDPNDEAEFARKETGSAGTEGMAPLIEALRHLVDDAKTMATAELAFQKARAQVIAAGARNLALFGLFALIFVIFALGALTVGLLLALTPLVTAWGATAIVVGGLGLATALCLRSALEGWRRISRALGGEQDEPE